MIKTNFLEQREYLKRKETILQRQLDHLEDTGQVLHVSKNGGHYDYFAYNQLENEQHKSNKYIPKAEIKTIRNLAQLEYTKKALKAVQDQIKVMNYIEKKYQPNALRDAYSSLHPGKQILVKPIELPDAEFPAKWISDNGGYEIKPIYDPDAPTTDKEERVRSKSEKILADKFFKLDIPYFYEKPLELKKFGTVHPDFTLLNIRTREVYLWEHCGMMDSEKYYTDFVVKNNAYIKNGFLPGVNLIYTFEGKNHILDMTVVENLIKYYLI